MASLPGERVELPEGPTERTGVAGGWEAHLDQIASGPMVGILPTVLKPWKATEESEVGVRYDHMCILERPLCPQHRGLRRLQSSNLKTDRMEW